MHIKVIEQRYHVIMRDLRRKLMAQVERSLFGETIPYSEESL